MSVNAVGNRENLVPASFRLFGVVQIDGKRHRIAVNKVQMEYESGLRNLPVARITFAVGVSVDAKQEPAKIHEILSQLNEFSTVELYLEATGKYSPTKKWPQGIHHIWTGQVVSVSPQRSGTGFSIGVDTVHWVKSLAYGSLISSGLYKSDMANVLVGYTLVDTGNPQESQAEDNEDSIAAIILSTFESTTDLWRGCILPALALFALPSPLSADSVNAPVFSATLEALLDPNSGTNTCGASATVQAQFKKTFGIEINGATYPGNTKAMEVVTGFPCSSVNDIAAARKQIMAGFNYPTYRFTTIREADLEKPHNHKLFFNNKAEVPIEQNTVELVVQDDAIKSQICKQVAYECGSSFASQSMLDKCLVFASQFRFELIPTARSVAVAPLNPTFYKTNTWRVLSADQILDFSSSITFPGAISGVVFLGDMPKSSTEDPNTSRQIAGPPVAGAQPPEDIRNIDNILAVYLGSAVGQLMVLRAPMWLQQLVNGELGTQGVDPAYAASTTPATARQGLTFSQVACALARAYWADVHVGPRNIQIQLPLRFDIGPGSYIKVEGINLGSTRFSVNGKGSTFYGCVTAVTVMIDAESSTGYTRISLSHVRSDADIDANQIYNLTNPLYTAASGWNGCPLVRLEDADMQPEYAKINTTSSDKARDTFGSAESSNGFLRFGQ